MQVTDYTAAHRACLQQYQWLVVAKRNLMWAIVAVAMYTNSSVYNVQKTHLFALYTNNSVYIQCNVVFHRYISLSSE